MENINSKSAFPISSAKDCTGCAACANVCPHGCIAMQGNGEGFLYPCIDETKCSKCGLCSLVCPVTHVLDWTNQKGMHTNCYAAYSNNDEIRFASSSGGIFSHLAYEILGQGGAVAGAQFKADHLVEHALVANPAKLDSLKKSKYIQSEIGMIFKEIVEQLKDRPILFVGTPCQCAGLRRFLNNSVPDNLYLVDLVCHGVGSPFAYLKYIQEMKAFYGSGISNICFRDKTYDFRNPEGKWRGLWMQLEFENGVQYFADDKTDAFFRAFLNNLCLRPCCYNCKFKGVERPVDLTIADFWGAKKVLPAFAAEAKKGISAILVHSRKGLRLWEKVQYSLTVCESQIDTMLCKNSACVRSVACPPQRRLFFEALKTMDFSDALKTAVSAAPSSPSTPS